jgi:hypothetical protein
MELEPERLAETRHPFAAPDEQQRARRVEQGEQRRGRLDRPGGHAHDPQLRFASDR